MTQLIFIWTLLALLLAWMVIFAVLALRPDADTAQILPEPLAEGHLISPQSISSHIATFPNEQFRDIKATPVA